MRHREPRGFAVFFSTDVATTEQAKAAEQEVAGEGDDGVGEKVGNIRSQLVTTQPDLVHQPGDDDAGRSDGESAPDCAPLPTMMAMRNGGIAAREATAIAIGASIAAVATVSRRATR